MPRAPSWVEILSSYRGGIIWGHNTRSLPDRGNRLWWFLGYCTVSNIDKLLNQQTLNKNFEFTEAGRRSDPGYKKQKTKKKKKKKKGGEQLRLTLE